tara:strand:+ start:2942 stop:3070 length:129 start_codon:yes stop_codon:yes gene_type:complete
MSYFEEKEKVKYIHTSKKSIEERLYLLERKIDIIIKKLNNKK